jgi:transcriptional regulator with XRE-family HTH domain
MRLNVRIDNLKTARLLQEARRKRGLNQGQLAIESGINQSQVSRILSGKWQRKSDGVDALCKFLKVRVVLSKSALPLSPSSPLAICLTEILDGTRKKERAVIRLLKSAQTLS